MNSQFEGKVALVTGGSSGIGLATAKLFAQRGATVYITGRRQKELDEAVREIGPSATGIQGDVSRLGDIDKVYQIIREQKGKHPVFVFTYEGNPVFQVNTAAWYKALARAGIENFRWHDLRHTWASWHVQGGTPLFALQELAG